MDAQILRQRRSTMPVAIVASIVIVILAALTAANLLRHTTLQGAATHEASSASSPTRMVPTAPLLVSRAEARFLVRRGATSAELAAENQQRWHRLQLRMLEDPWVLGLLRHRPGTTMVDLVRVYLSRR
jgi:hypothetical protein